MVRCARLSADVEQVRSLAGIGVLASPKPSAILDRLGRFVVSSPYGQDRTLNQPGSGREGETKVMGTKKTLVFCGLIVLVATVSGMIYGQVVG